MSSNSISHKEYLKKYLSGDVKKKKKKKISGGNIKRSVIVDDDIDLKSMRPLEDDEVELYQMDEDAPQIAGIVDERPVEIKAQEYYSSRRWKVFGGEDGVNVVDTMNKAEHAGDKHFKTTKNWDKTDSLSREENNEKKGKHYKKDTDTMGFSTDKIERMNDKNNKKSMSSIRQHSENKYNGSDSDEPPPRAEKGKSARYEDDSDMSPPRKYGKNSSSDSDASPPRSKHQKKPKSYERNSDMSFKRKHGNKFNSDSDASPPRSKYTKKHEQRHDSDESPPRKDSRKMSSQHSKRNEERERGKMRNRSYSNSPPRRHKTDRLKYKNYSDNLPRREQRFKQEKSDSDASPHRRSNKHFNDDNSLGRARKRSSSDSDFSPPRGDKRKSPNRINSKSSHRISSPPYSSYKSRKIHVDNSSRLSRRDIGEKISKRSTSDSDNSPPRGRTRKGSDSDLSPPRKSAPVNDRPLKKTLYKPHDSSSDESSKIKSKKMKTTLDGKQAGLQDAKDLRKEMSDLKMREDTMFSKMDASVSGVGAAPVKRDRKTGQIRDLAKEKEVQREKEAKESVVTEKYHKWGKGIKQTEEAAIRAAEAIKEMSKPLARYVDDQDLDEFLKAQEREGDPMLEYIKKKQSEATPLHGEKPIYKGSWAPNRFSIRPGYRWDGVVRSNGYEQEWFKTKNARKARDEEAYKWSTSDM